MFHHGSMWLPLGCGPGRPADEAVDCVAALWLVQRELVAPSVKFVAAILQPIWPRDQYLTPARGAHFVGSVSVDKLPAAHGVGAKSSTNLDDHCLLISGRDRDLLTRWWDHRYLPSGHPHLDHRTVELRPSACDTARASRQDRSAGGAIIASPVSARMIRAPRPKVTYAHSQSSATTMRERKPMRK